jgi:hypothetical protein
MTVTAARLSTGVAVATVVTALLAAVTSATTPPRTGPFCAAGCLTYPYDDAAAYVPRDFGWMYPQSLLVLLALVLLICLHQQARHLGSAIAAGLTGVSAAVLLGDYALQVATVQPSLRRGETGGLALFSQYNPHGAFIALEDLGYLLLGLALLTAAAVFTATTRLDRALRWTLGAGGALTVVTLPVLAVRYGTDLEYRYEVAAMALTWLTLIAGGVLLARWFHRPASIREPAAATPTGRQT